MKIFLSVPFSDYVTELGVVQEAYAVQIQSLLKGLRSKGHTVYCALEYTGYKIGGDHSPEEELQHDLNEIEASDLMVVLLEEKLSAGVQIELGYSYAKQKKVALYQVGKIAWSNAAFAKLGNNQAIPIKDVADFVTQVIQKY